MNTFNKTCVKLIKCIPIFQIDFALGPYLICVCLFGHHFVKVFSVQFAISLKINRHHRIVFTAFPVRVKTGYAWGGVSNCLHELVLKTIFCPENTRPIGQIALVRIIVLCILTYVFTAGHFRGNWSASGSHLKT